MTHSGVSLLFWPKGEIRVLIVVLVYWLLVPATAHAYIDPSTGSLALQATVGFILSALFVVKLYWKRLREWTSARFGGRRDAGRG
jgi:cytochrome b